MLGGIKIAKRTYKQKYEEILKKTLDDKITNHTKNYIHIPFSWKRIGMFFALLGSTGLAIFNFFLIISIGNNYNVWELLWAEYPSIVHHSLLQLTILYPLIGGYISIGLVYLCIVALIKGGFDKIKSHKDFGVILGLLFGLVLMLSGSFILGLLASLIFLLFGDMVLGLILGSIGGMCIGLLFGLVPIHIGAIKEFEFNHGGR